MTKIIGFAGTKQSGKNTMCNIWSIMAWQQFGLKGRAHVHKQNGQILFDGKVVSANEVNWKVCKTYALADALKEFAITVLNIEPHKIYGTDEQKNELTHIHWENMPGVITTKKVWNAFTKTMDEKNWKDPGWPMLYHAKGPMTGREVLQYFGTDVIRRMYGEAWINSCINRIRAEQPYYAFVSDIRFPNEIVKFAHEGVVVGLTRSPYEDEHASEKVVLDGCKYIVDNKDANNVEELMKCIQETFGYQQNLLTI